MTKKRTPTRYRGPAWSELELAIMRKLFPAISSDMMARVLRRSRKSISAKAYLMGLGKSPEHMQREYALRAERSKAHPHTIKPGARPWNLGLRGVTGVHPNNRANYFKPGKLSGRAAQNYVPVGTTAINNDGLLKKKWTDDPQLTPHRRWRPVHVMVWEAAHGPVPPGHIVVFKHPSLRTTVEHEITLDKLECISRAENMLRNSYWENFPPELAQLYRIKGQLRRKINYLERINGTHPDRRAQPRDTNNAALDRQKRPD